jgi:hypothetical protein
LAHRCGIVSGAPWLILEGLQTLAAVAAKDVSLYFSGRHHHFVFDMLCFSMEIFSLSFAPVWRPSKNSRVLSM